MDGITESFVITILYIFYRIWYHSLKFVFYSFEKFIRKFLNFFIYIKHIVHWWINFHLKKKLLFWEINNKIDENCIIFESLSPVLHTFMIWDNPLLRQF